jgi:hypothetical protein
MLSGTSSDYDGHTFKLWPAFDVGVNYGALNIKSMEDLDEFQAKHDNFHNRTESLDDIPTLGVSASRMLVPNRLAVSPYSSKRMFWEIVGACVLVYDIGIITLQVFDPPVTTFTTVMAYIILWYWTFDIVVSFFAGYFQDDGELVMNLRSIARRYMTRWFLLDIVLVLVDWLTVGSLMLGAADATSDLETVGLARLSKIARTTRIVRLLRLLRLRKLKELVARTEDAVGSEYTAIMFNLTKNMFGIMLINHTLACIWYWIGQKSMEDSGTGWVEKYGVESMPWSSKYLLCLYWSLTQFTPGSPNLQPQNDGEKVFCVFTLLFALVAFSIVVSSVTNAMTRLFSMQASQKKNVWMLKRYLKEQKVTRDLNARIMRYVTIALGSRRRYVQSEDVELLRLLSQPLRDEMDMQVFMRELLIHPFLKMFTQRSRFVMARICRQSMVEMALSRDDTLFGIGETAHAMYFVVRGVLRYKSWMLADASRLHGVLLNAQHWCCEAVLWTQWVHQGDMSADIECLLMALDAAKFRDIVCEHSMDRSFVTGYARAFLKALNNSAKGHTKITDLQDELLNHESLTMFFAWRAGHSATETCINLNEIAIADMPTMQRRSNSPENSRLPRRLLTSSFFLADDCQNNRAGLKP